MGTKATAELRAKDGRDIGRAKLVETNSGILIHLRLKGLSPGAHGIHIHETGKCERDFESAGGIFNPLGNKHGLLNEEGPMAGDLPNLHVPASGEVEVELLAPFVTLSKDSEDTLLDGDGAALVVFERADDHFTEPEGGAGGRIACGAIVSQGQ